MFCKFCGRPIEPNVQNCPYCGEKQIPHSGGNGFWDILDEKSEHESAPQVPTVPLQTAVEKKPQKEQKVSKSQKRKNSPLLAVCVVGVLIIGVIGLAEIIDMKAQLRAIATGQNASQEHIEYAIEPVTNALDKLQESQNGMREEMDGLQKSIDNLNRNYIGTSQNGGQSEKKEQAINAEKEESSILSQPKNAVWEDDGAEFYVEIGRTKTGSLYETEWQYWQRYKGWQTIPKTGGTFKISVEENRTCLAVTGKDDTEFLSMRFRCRIKVNGKYEYSDTVAVIPSNQDRNS